MVSSTLIPIAIRNLVSVSSLERGRAGGAGPDVGTVPFVLELGIGSAAGAGLLPRSGVCSEDIVPAGSVGN